MAVRKLSQTKEILRFEGSDALAYWRRFAALLTLAVIMATMGLIRDSGAVVIAAMLIAPLMTPILGVAAAMVMGWTRRMLYLLLVVLIASAASVLLAWAMVFVADVPRGILIPNEVTARTDPGIEELIVALAAGAAGAYVQIQRKEISLLPGAAIGVSLVPPLSAAGILLYFDEPTDAYEAILLFLTNLAAIILSACTVYIFSGVRASLRLRNKRARRFSIAFAAVMAALGVIVVQLGSETVDRFRENQMEAELALAIRDWADPVSVEIIRIDVHAPRQRADVWIVVDLPVSAMRTDIPLVEALPESLLYDPLSDVIVETLGPDYFVAVRFQTRIAGMIGGDLPFTLPAQSPDEVIDE